MKMDSKYPIPDKSQLYYGNVVHWITIASCLITLIAPVFILLFPETNMLNPNMIFDAIFMGSKSAEIWVAGGVPFQTGDFWPLFWANLFTPDGVATFGIVMGCSVTLWALIPAIWNFFRKREFFYAGVSIFVALLITLAMSGIVNMAA